MRYLTVLFRYACLATVLAAALLIFLDFFWQNRAWETQFNAGGIASPGGLIETGALYAVFWLIAALIQIITIKRTVFGMDFCRAISLIAASFSIMSSWPEIWEWHISATGSFGEPLPRPLAWGGADIVLSLPVALLSLLVLLLFGVARKI